jgi:hypothetical protein
MKHLFRLAVVSLSLGLVPIASAQDDQYVKVFNLILQADALRDSGKGREALEKYLEAQDGLKKIQSAFPSWNDKVVAFRLNYMDTRIKPLMSQFPGTTMPKPIQPAGTQDPLVSRISGLEKALYDKDQQLITFRAGKERAEAAMRDAEARLREALAARPKDVDPAEMAKAQDRVKGIQKDLDIQKITLEQQNAKLTTTAKERDELKSRLDDEKRELPMLKAANEGLKKQVADMNRQLGSLPRVQDLQNQVAAVKTELRAAQVQNEALAKDNRKMETLLTDPEFTGGGDSSKLKDLERQKAALEAQLREAQRGADRIKQLEKERDDLQKFLNEALKPGSERKK